MSSKSPRILVVDDYPEAAEITSALLSTMGYETISAMTGGEGIAMAEEFRPDIALLDLDLPDLSGLEVARRLREQRGDGIYLAAITGRSDRTGVIAAGFDTFIVKPIEARTLSRIVAAAAAKLRRHTE